MKTCPYCQAQLDDSAVFCGSCGQKIDAPVDTTVSVAFVPSEPTPAPAVAAPAPATVISTAPPVQTAEKPAKKPTKVPLVLGLILAGLGIACIAAGVLLLVL